MCAPLWLPPRRTYQQWSNICFTEPKSWWTKYYWPLVHWSLHTQYHRVLGVYPVICLFTVIYTATWNGSGVSPLITSPASTNHLGALKLRVAYDICGIESNLSPKPNLSILWWVAERQKLGVQTLGPELGSHFANNRHNMVTFISWKEDETHPSIPKHTTHTKSLLIDCSHDSYIRQTQLTSLPPPNWTFHTRSDLFPHMLLSHNSFLHLYCPIVQILF